MLLKTIMMSYFQWVALTGKCCAPVFWLGLNDELFNSLKCHLLIFVLGQLYASVYIPLTCIIDYMESYPSDAVSIKHDAFLNRKCTHEDHRSSFKAPSTLGRAQDGSVWIIGETEVDNQGQIIPEEHFITIGCWPQTHSLDAGI